MVQVPKSLKSEEGAFFQSLGLNYGNMQGHDNDKSLTTGMVVVAENIQPVSLTFKSGDNLACVQSW